MHVLLSMSSSQRYKKTPASLCSTFGCWEGNEESPTARNNEQKANVKASSLINIYISLNLSCCQHLQDPDRARSSGHRESLWKEQLSRGSPGKSTHPALNARAKVSAPADGQEAFSFRGQTLHFSKSCFSLVFSFYLPRPSVASLLVLWAQRYTPQLITPTASLLRCPPRVPPRSTERARTFCTCS